MPASSRRNDCFSTAMQKHPRFNSSTDNDGRHWETHWGEVGSCFIHHCAPRAGQHPDSPRRLKPASGPAFAVRFHSVVIGGATGWLVGPPGLEPGTKGFAWPVRFRAARTISSPSAFAGGARDALACHQGHCSPQVVSAPSGGVPPAWLRVTTGRTAEASLNSSRSRPAITGRRHHIDESPALTIEL